MRTKDATSVVSPGGSPTPIPSGWLLFLLSLFACSGEADRAPTELQGLSLEERAILLGARWEADPAAVREELAAETDPHARAFLVDSVSRHHLGSTASLCRLLDPQDQGLCFTLQNRPHLWTGLPKEDAAQAPGAQGLVEHVWRATLPRPVPARSGDGRVPHCVNEPDPQACVLELVDQQAGPGARSLCLGLEEERARAGCLAVAAASTLRPEDASPEAFEQAARQCVETGPALQDCLQRTAGALARFAPPAGDVDPAHWLPLRSRLDAWVAGLAWLAPEIELMAADYAWAQVAWPSVDRGATPTAAAHEILPYVAEFHLRCALALRLVEENGSEGSLDEAAARVSLAWSSPNAGARTIGRVYELDPGPPIYLSFESQLGFWRQYLGARLRAASRDEESDTRICLLEAAARRGGVPATWSAAAEGFGEYGVTETATRLGQEALPVPPGSGLPASG